MVQGACKLILEPIFEADFQPGSYGYRPKRTAHEAVERAAQAIVVRKTRVIDIDLAAYLECSLAAEIEATARAENLLPQLGRVTAPLLARVSELDCRNRSAEQPADCSRHPP